MGMAMAMAMDTAMATVMAMAMATAMAMGTVMATAIMRRTVRINPSSKNLIRSLAKANGLYTTTTLPTYSPQNSHLPNFSQA